MNSREHVSESAGKEKARANRVEPKKKGGLPDRVVRGAVLLVDDDPYVLKALKRVLRDQPYQVLTAGSAWEAMSVMGRRRVDVVVMDYWMPVLDGLRLARDLQAEYPETVRVMLTGCSELAVVREAAGRGEIFRYLLKPWDEIELLNTVALAMSTALQSSSDIGGMPVVEGLASLSGLIAAGEGQTIPCSEADDGRDWIQVMTDLSRAVESRDSCTMGHSSRVAILSTWMGHWLGFSPERNTDLKLGALLHDVGKIAVPDSILFKPAKLTAGEMSAIKDHSMLGYQILKEQGANAAIAAIARHHHENYDGSGYPARLAGAEIPLEARIVRLADSFDAMYNRRPYREAMPMPKIIAEVKSLAGSQYDPELVDLFIAVVQDRAHELYA